MNPYLQINNLTVVRDGNVVIQIDQMVVEKSDVVAIIGPNGAGKSSLLLSLARIIKPVIGSKVNLADDHDAKVGDLEFRRKLALVMQEPLLVDATVRTNIMLGLRYRGVNEGMAEKAVAFWAEKFKIEKLLDRPAQNISGGEAQRVSLARAFVLNPALLLLDEPFSALDPQTRRSILKDLKVVLAESQTTTLFVTHDLKDVSALADKVAVIWDGKLAQFGSWKEVTSQPATDEIRTYLDGHL